MLIKINIILSMNLQKLHQNCSLSQKMPKILNNQKMNLRQRKQNRRSAMQIMEKHHRLMNSQQKQDICTKAIQHIRKGSSILIDWSTRTNFRVNSHKNEKLKTQPISLYLAQSPLSHEKSSIEGRKLQLARLLRQHHKKRLYNNTFQQKQVAQLFQKGHKRLQLSSEKNSPHDIAVNRSIDHSRQTQLTNTIKPQKLQSLQKHLLEMSKLTFLKQDLRTKFTEIRQLYNDSTSKKKNRHSLAYI